MMLNSGTVALELEAKTKTRAGKAELAKGKSTLRTMLNKNVADSSKAPAKKNPPKAPAAPKKAGGKKATAAASKKRAAAESEEDSTSDFESVRPFFAFGAKNRLAFSFPFVPTLAPRMRVYPPIFVLWASY